MSKMKTGLGRGLDALINSQRFKDTEKSSADFSDLQKDDGAGDDVLAKIPVGNISPNPFQPRTHFEPEAFEELKKSILSNGLIQPITVRRKAQGLYELISGERRLKACAEIGMKDIPAYIIKVDTDEAMLALALIENIQREKLNPIEIGSAYALDEELSTEIRGRDAVSGLPRSQKITSEEIREALKEPFDKIVIAVRNTLERTAPELASDLISNGLVLVGGGALIRGIDRLLIEETGLPVRVAEEPLTAVARGTGYLLEHLDLYKSVLQDEDIRY